jgi:hypothetical protein
MFSGAIALSGHHCEVGDAQGVITDIRKIWESTENELEKVARCSTGLRASRGMMTDLEAPLFNLMHRLQAKLQVSVTNASSEQIRHAARLRATRHSPKLKPFQLRHLLTLIEFKADLEPFAIHTEYEGIEPEDLVVPLSTMTRKDPKQGF